MTSNQHHLAKEVFLQVCDVPETERAAHLEKACGDDQALRREVEALLSFDRMTPGPQPHQKTPDRIGHFRLLQKIGEGGMGEVWEAEQEAPVRRRVAFKLIKWGMDSKEVLARFESERQAMALMNHPNIAKAFEAGTDDGGRPYFAMEYVKGVPLTEYCDSQRLETRRRLELFKQVCEGVQHAHQKGVIHRDIKPSNILVAVENGKPVPKIIDFGVAKATSQRLTERTLFTELGQWIGTPEYMSPEQAELTSLDVDTRSDVYSLGVVLYELLAGAQPFDSSELRTAGFDEMRRRIREDDPPRPSTRVSSLGHASQVAAERRRTDRQGLARTLRGDLDWIVMKALEKDRTRRYGSPSELAADVDRYLHHEPVEASPPSTIYRVRKFISRHRMGVGAAAVVMLALLAGVMGTTIGLVRARAEAETASKVSTLLAGVFTDLDPGAAMGQIPSATVLLDRGVDRIRSELADQPVVQARLLDTVGNAYRNLGRYSEARSLLEEALRLREEHLGAGSAEVGYSAVSLGWVAYYEGAFDEALRLFEKATSNYQESLGPGHRFVAAGLGFTGAVYWRTGDLARAREALDRSMGILRDIEATDEPIAVHTLWPSAMVLMAEEQHDRAQVLLERAVELYEAHYGPEHPGVAGLLNDLGRCYLFTLRLDEARPFFERALAINEQALGSDHPNLLWPLANLASIDRRQGDFDAAEAGFERALAIAERSLGLNHPDLAWILNPYSSVLMHRGDIAGARALVERALYLTETTFGPHHLDVALTLERAGMLSYLEEDWDQALRQYERAFEIREAIFGAGHLSTGWNLYDQGCIHALAGEPEAAKQSLQRALDVGWANRRIFEDDDYDSLRSDPEFEAILEEVRARL